MSFNLIFFLQKFEFVKHNLNSNSIQSKQKSMPSNIKYMHISHPYLSYLIHNFVTIRWQNILLLTLQRPGGHWWPLSPKFQFHLRGSTTLNSLIFQLCFIILKIKLYLCRNLCENFREIGRKMKKL